MLTGLVCLSPQASSRTISTTRGFLLIAFAASQVPRSALMRRLTFMIREANRNRIEDITPRVGIFPESKLLVETRFIKTIVGI
jgi:hypothetical protein